MKPYAEINTEKLFLPQQVDAHRFEVCTFAWKGETQYLLCPKVKTRYRQATGIVLEREGNELKPAWSGRALARHTFPLAGMETWPLHIDWSAGGPVTIRHATAEEETTAERAE